MNKEGGVWGLCRFWSKIAEYLVWCGQVHCQETCKCVECLQKNGGPPQPRTMPADRCRWVPRTLLLLAEACTEGARPPEDNPRVFFLLPSRSRRVSPILHTFFVLIYLMKKWAISPVEFPLVWILLILSLCSSILCISCESELVSKGLIKVG